MKKSKFYYLQVKNNQNNNDDRLQMNLTHYIVAMTLKK